MSDARLSAAERIRRRPEFVSVYADGSKTHGRYMTLFALNRGPGAGAGRFGVAATRKLGPAVVRNRAKRLARELFRQNKAGPGIDLVVVPRREMLDASFAQLRSDYRATLARSQRVGRR